jgi:hypothetical protein
MDLAVGSSGLLKKAFPLFHSTLHLMGFTVSACADTLGDPGLFTFGSLSRALIVSVALSVLQLFG